MLVQWFSTRIPRSPKVSPVQSSGFARSYTNAMVDCNLCFYFADMGKGAPQATGMFTWGSTQAKS